ncbi:hypothetical protein GCM10008995_15920 [Halobellus salinus]|uniref:Dockerin domain-containing protein n=1 Tax=Halobellus salinus TaxID=931585 RepID=A0A830EFH7_9EURY|nr:hypothetical protein [Halobellus salinus]GGJ06841.1 hypothetical protein GCM10008995_15920 [Halobellus salinus]SMP15264.1 hypothetical protein SAMN06265347_105100 [Halobellus salinus]
MSPDTRRGSLVIAVVVVVVVGGLTGVATAESTIADTQRTSTESAAAMSAGSHVRAAAGSTSVRLSPTTATINESRTQTFDIVVSDADGGVGAITTTVTVDDTEVGTITDVSLNGDPGAETIDIADDGSEVFVRAALMDTDDSGSVTVGTLTVEGAGPGTTDIDPTVDSLGDEDGDPYDVGTTPGSSLTVEDTAESVDLDISADASSVDPGDDVTFTVRRADSDALVSATVALGDNSYDTGIDGEATVEIDESMASDAGTVTAVASKESTDDETFRNDSVTLDLDGEESATPADTATATPAPGDGPRVTFEPASTSVGVGEQTELRLVATGVDGGVGAVEAEISVDSAAATITDLEVAGGAGVEQTDIGTDATTGVVRGALMDTNDAGAAHIATVTVEGAEQGTTSMRVEVDSLGDESGTSYAVGGTTAVTVSVGDTGSEDDGESEAGSSDVVLSVSEMPTGFERASVTVRTVTDASVTETRAELVSDSQLRVVSDDPRTTTVQAVDLAGNVGAFDEERTIARLTYDQQLSPDDVEIEVGNLRDDNRTSVPGDRISVEVRSGSLFDEPLPGASTDAAPGDPDRDGRYEDVDGDGNVTFNDAVVLSFADASELNNEQVAAVDFDSDGDLDIDDAVALAFE